ncbi:iron chelate uptake ABC transporter family permease subunit, partial [Flagellimonas flava]|uniref:iron chelate uptake ABC transporter family permease subunit n=1 Tax=Flagellimonas flava TaxID=570519 RepID=UPI003D65B02F
LLLAFLLNISSGSVLIRFEAVLNLIFGGSAEVESCNYILWNYRMPKAFTSVFVGGGLALSGLLLQTLFRNPLAGPFVLA